jgi:hypothetical protein
VSNLEIYAQVATKSGKKHPEISDLISFLKYIGIRFAFASGSGSQKEILLKEKKLTLQ